MQLSLIGEQASRLVQVFLQLGGISALPIYIEQYTPHVTRMPLLGCNGHPASLFKLFGEALKDFVGYHFGVEVVILESNRLHRCAYANNVDASVDQCFFRRGGRD